jgi:hypothetical protein
MGEPKMAKKKQKKSGSRKKAGSAKKAKKKNVCEFC